MLETKQRKPYIAPLANRTGIIRLKGTSIDLPVIFSFCNDYRPSLMSSPRQSSKGKPKHYFTRDPSLVTALAWPLLLGCAPIFRLCFSNPALSSAGFPTYVGPKVSLDLWTVSFFLHLEPFMSIIIYRWVFAWTTKTCFLRIINSKKREERPSYQRSKAGDPTKKYRVKFIFSV